ncbi:MAG TPA: flagellar hook assembly protein FlgD [Rhizomicrobium sp.]|jgi:flagellar basal-body rod modification protein FlgD|nr:flagellar hook assembly protein FlgD [Rhizomicrobium sp.]
MDPTSAAAASSSSAAASAVASQNASSAQELSGNFDTFLQLLTTQLQNQDPLSPMDSNQFTQQLVEFSQVEQQINTNSNLQTLISLQQGGSASGAVSYLGKTVTISNGNASLMGGTATWNYGLAASSAATTLTVTDSNGNTVYTGPGANTPGTSQFVWNGQDNNGNQLPDGVYTLNVAAQGSDGSAITTAVTSQGTVSEIDTSGSSPQLVVGLMEIPLASVAAVSSQ